MDPKLLSTNPEDTGYSKYEITEIPETELKKYAAEHDEYFKNIAAREAKKAKEAAKPGGRRLRRTRRRRMSAKRTRRVRTRRSK